MVVPMAIALDDLRASVSEVLPDLPDDPAVDLFASGIVDSLRVIEIVLALESAFGVSFEPDDLRADNFASLDRLLVTVQRMAGEGALAKGGS